MSTIDTDNIKAMFSLKALRIAATCRANNDIRYYLNGVHVMKYPDGPGVLVSAACGHTAILVHDADGDIVGSGSDGVIIEVKPGLLAAAARAKDGHINRVPACAVLEGQRLSVNAGYGMAHTNTEIFVSPGPAQINGRFPDLLRVVPEFAKLKPHTVGGMNSRYLARVHEAASITNRKGYNPVRFWAQDKNSGIAVQFDNCPEALMILMPMRDDHNGKFGIIERLERRRSLRVSAGTPLPGRQPSDAAPTPRQRQLQHEQPPV